MCFLTERGFSNPRFPMLAGKKTRHPFLIYKTATYAVGRYERKTP
jgi:hypothetical protein